MAIQGAHRRIAWMDPSQREKEYPELNASQRETLGKVTEEAYMRATEALKLLRRPSSNTREVVTRTLRRPTTRHSVSPVTSLVGTLRWCIATMWVWD